MGDTYCPLCGIPVGPLCPWRWDNPADIEQDYDPELLPGNRAPELQWIEDWRIIGENIQSENVCKVWVSGPARFSWGRFPFERGEDVENFPESNEIAVYICERDEPFAVPFHVSCREIFCRYLGITVPQLDKHAFFEGLKSLAEDECEGTRLGIDYGTVEGNMEQDWVRIRDEEYFVFNPAEDNQLNEYVSNLPILTTEGGDSKASPAGFNTAGDPFAKLPPSVLLTILSELRQPNAIFQLRIASPCFSNLQLGSVFWRQQIKTDMPWIWELPEAGDAGGSDRDWKSVYQTISRAILPPFESKKKFRGLSNRVRIWDEIMPQIAAAHSEAEELVKALNAIVPEILRGASGFFVKRLGRSGRGEDLETIQTLADSLKDLELATPALVFDWSDEGSLIAIRVVKDGQQEDAPRRAQSPTPAKTDKVVIPGSSWLTGMVFTSRGSDERPLHETRQIVGLQINFTGSDSVFLGSQEGDKRLIRVDENKLVVGLKSVCSEDNTFHQFSLVQQSLIEPSDHAVEGSLSQPNQGSKFQYIQGHRTIVEQAREIFNSDAEPYLWYRELPPATLRLSPFYGLNQNQDIVPIKHFVFGSTEEEVADIKSIAVDIELCGFQVDYGNRPSKFFGPRLHALKTLTINGKGGERIDRITVSPRKDDKVPLIRIDTNRNRTLIVGDATQRTTPIELTDEDQRLRPCGLTASWSGTTYAPWLRTIGIMGSPATGHVDMADLPPEVDGNGFLWAPSRPPSGLVETGPVVGKQPVAQKPWGGCTVSWLDISRPLSSVRMTIAYSVHASRVHISAITFKYADGDHDEVSIGPDKFFPKAHCNWCRYCDREPEGNKFPHYRHETWEVGGNKLSGLRLWTRGSEGLDAIQFIVDGETKMQSPVWGVWMQAPEGLEPSLIQFAGHGSGEATALKVFLGDNMQRDTIVYGFQALVPL